MVSREWRRKIELEWRRDFERPLQRPTFKAPSPKIADPGNLTKLSLSLPDSRYPLVLGVYHRGGRL